eukprot:767627-Hanusia_phi.AAC.3
MNLTAQERLLIESIQIYRPACPVKAIQGKSCAELALLSVCPNALCVQSLPKERPIASKLERVVEEACEWVSEPEEERAVRSLQGARSYITDWLPSFPSFQVTEFAPWHPGSGPRSLHALPASLIFLQIMLEGGSKIEQFQPPKPSSTKVRGSAAVSSSNGEMQAKIVELLHSLPGSPPSNKNAKMWDSQSHSPGSGALRSR